MPEKQELDLGNAVWLPLFGSSDSIGGGIPDNRTVFVTEDNKYTTTPEIKLINESQIDEISDLLNLGDLPAESPKKTSPETFSTVAVLLKEGSTKGSRNNDTFEILRHLKLQGLNKELAQAAISTWNKTVVNPPLEKNELRRILESVYSDRGSKFNWSDAGNAELLIYLHGDKIRYDHTTGIWLIWSGQLWKKDTTGHVKELAIDAARYRQRMAADIQDPKKKKKAFEFGLSAESKVRIGFCLELAKSMPPVASVAVEWNQDPSLLQFENGVLNLKTMEFGPGRPDLMISQSVGFEYDRGATCLTWERVVREIMNNNSALVTFLQRAVGYSLTGDISEQCFFLMYGTGANGKTVFQTILRLTLGNYAQDSPFTAFEYRYGNSQSNDLARLHAARIVTSAESGSSRRLDEERLKAVSGGDSITARFLFQEFFTYIPNFKLWLAVNSLPRVQDFSDGYWRKVRLIPFEKRFRGEKADLNIIDKLKPELPGILNWALEGFQQWQEKGLNPPEEVLKATKDYQTEADVVADFLDSFTVVNTNADLNIRTKTSDLYRAFLKWWENEHSGNPIRQNGFSRRVRLATGLKPEKIGGSRYFIGIELKNDEELPF